MESETNWMAVLFLKCWSLTETEKLNTRLNPTLFERQCQGIEAKNATLEHVGLEVKTESLASLSQDFRLPHPYKIYKFEMEKFQFLDIRNQNQTKKFSAETESLAECFMGYYNELFLILLQLLNHGWRTI